MDRSRIGRELVALRPTTEATCAECGTAFTARARKRKPGEELQPLAQYCSARCRAKAHYQANRETKLAYQKERRKSGQSDTTPRA
jgi:hypothetical protein